MRPNELIKTIRNAALIGAVAAFALPASMAFAQEEGYYPDEDDNPNDSRFVYTKNDWKLSAGYWISPTGTDSVTDAITGSYAFCSRLQQEEYLVDCLGEQLEEIAKAMPETGDYVEAKKILAEAAAKMRQLAAANAAPAKPRLRATGNVQGKQIRTKPLTAVRTERLPAVKQQAANILAEAETKLLRSAQSSDRRLIAYAQMAKAVGSNKTLLRSA